MDNCYGLIALWASKLGFTIQIDHMTEELYLHKEVRDDIGHGMKIRREDARADPLWAFLSAVRSWARSVEANQVNDDC